ncbi:permease [Mesorhizobium sp. ZC-5]|uniref:permease n=1 Tax=Mesorhizobium sp. ZC-5 TaxID=2986066 RepID=UPI0021E71ADF|nr:permease [Mesorhizobium sp. ZC-5]MCV3240662.1 permease [Mesorhizobium sp. ZC-5]
MASSATLPYPSTRIIWALTVAIAAGASLQWPEKAVEIARFVAVSFLDVALLIGAGLLLSAWVAASGAGTITAEIFRGRPVTTIVLASFAGTITPVCGVTVLPLMTGLLASGVPLAPVMAFWLSSPVTDPAMFAATWATLGLSFAVAKTISALGLGIFAGGVTAALATTQAVKRPLRRSRASSGETCGHCVAGYRAWVWGDPERSRIFWLGLLKTARLVAVCLTLAFAAEYLLRDAMPDHLLGTYVGTDSPYAIPLAVSVGAPMYLDGYAALPMVRALLDLGMSPGAALAFLVSGSAVSIWGVLAVVPILRTSTLMLFVTLAVIGSAVAGYVFDWAWNVI